MKRNKYTVVDLFCGCGGISEGFRKEGFTIIGGVDFNKSATATFQNNFKDALVYTGDISEISNKYIESNFSGVDIVVGGPPCQGFSSANRHQKESDDPRNKLFFEYLRFIEILKPKAFLIENVKEILSKDKGYAKDRIIEITSNLGYNVDVRILLASDYGVPQKRRRAVFVGIRKDIGGFFPFDEMFKISKEKTVMDAIGDLCGKEKEMDGELKKFLKDSDEIFNHTPKYPNEKVQRRMSFVPQGGNWKDVPSELWDTQRNNRHSSAYKRLSFSEPSITIDTGHMNYFHPIENRIPTVRESARIQSFPDSFIFSGSQGEQYRQVGNAVPPLLAAAVAKQIKMILKEI